MSILQSLCAYKTILFAAWKGETDDDRLFYSGFNGKTWDNQSPIPGNSSIGPALAVFGDTLYAAWKGEDADQRLFYASFDGSSWSTQAQIGGVASSVGPSLAAFGGKLYAAWKGEGSDQRLFYASFDGSSWSAQTQIAAVGSSVGPSLSAFGGKLYAAWKGEGSDQRLFYASFDGSSWSAQTQIAGVGSSVGLSLAAFGSKLYAAWKGEGSDQRLFYASFDGSIWSTQTQIGGVASSIGPALSEFNGRLYAMWKGSVGDQRIWYASFDGSQWSDQATLPGNTGQDVIRVIWIPDVHLEQAGQPTTWIQQCTWLKENQALYNIQAVLAAGDLRISTSGQDDLPTDLPPAWSEGLATVDAMNGPYLVTAGNHDYDNIYDTTSFDTNIGHQRIYQKPWYVGYWDAPGEPPNPTPGSPPAPPTGNPSKATQAITFPVGARQILVVALECFPRQGALDWAEGIINNNPLCEVIVITHVYMTMAGNLFTANGDDNDNYGTSQTWFPGYRTGLDINNWAKSFPNVHVVLCGHDIPTPGKGAGSNESHRVDNAVDGHPIVGIYADYQFLIPPNEVTSQVVLLLELGETQVNVRAFNTTANAELSTPYPYVLPYGNA